MQLRRLIFGMFFVTTLWQGTGGRAEFVYDLRFAGGGKSVTVQPNTDYTVQLWGIITGDAVKTNDAWGYGYFSVDPAQFGTGGFSNPTNLATVGVTGLTLGTNTSVSGSVGVQRSTTGTSTTEAFAANLKGWGGLGGATGTTTGWALWRGGNSPGFAGGVFNAQSVDLGTNGQEVLLATMTIRTGDTINTNGTAADYTSFSLRVQNTLKSGVSTTQAIGYNNDGPTLQTYSNSTVGGQTTSVSFLSVLGGGGGDPAITAAGPLTFNLLKGASVDGVTQAITLTNSSSTAASGSTASVGGADAAKFTASNPGAVGASGGTANSNVGLTAGATATSGTYTASIGFASTPGSVPAINSVGVTLNVGNATTGPSNTFGTALTASVAATTAYAPLSASTATVGTGTTVSLVAGTNATGMVETVSMAFRTPTAAETNTAVQPFLLTDVVNLSGMSSTPGATLGSEIQTDAFALQMSYTPPVSLPGNLSASYIGVYWLNGASQWVQSRFGNFLGGDANSDSILDGALAIGGYQGTYAQFATQFSVTDANLSNFLGSYGVDTVGGTAWSVLNHNSSFAVAIPEPSTLLFGALAALGFAAHGLRKRRTIQA